MQRREMNRLTFFCDLAEATTPLPHFWEHTVGSDHAPVALRADWQNQLKRAHDELGFQHVRFHGLLSDDFGTLVRNDNKLVYSFFNCDRVFDFLLSIGMRPFVELSFMPTALASGDKTVFSYNANVTPPRNYEQWSALIERLVSHCVERYGSREVAGWFFEVWNEPNLRAFWDGTQRNYFRLYRHTAEAIKNIDASFKVGGPATARSQWIEDFVAFCDRNEVPADGGNDSVVIDLVSPSHRRPIIGARAFGTAVPNAGRPPSHRSRPSPWAHATQQR